MTNYEKFRDRIKKDPIFAIEDGEFKKCVEVECPACEFYEGEESCVNQRFEWCSEEYHEPETKEEPTETDKVTCVTYLAALVVEVCKKKDIDLMYFATYLRGLDALDLISGGEICHS